MRKFLSEYGMLLVLLALCMLFSVLTLKKESATDSAAVARVIEEVSAMTDSKDTSILVAGAVRKESADFAKAVDKALREGGFAGVRQAVGSPRDVRLAFEGMTTEGKTPRVVIADGEVSEWTVFDELAGEGSGVDIIVPKERWQSDFLKRSNLVAIVDRIVVIAVIAIGMTLIILTGGIDLSVGSLLAFSAVIATLVMKWLGGLNGGPGAVWLGFFLATLACGVIGLTSGFLVAFFRVAPFITTLAVMLVARGCAYLVTGGFSIYQVPPSLIWLGQGKTLGIPNTVILLAVLYALAHVFMSYTRFGRYIYAVGGNEEAARLSGVPVKLVLMFVYLVGGLAAGFAGCIQASQINSGAPNLGVMFELYVIAAVVVGGTSLSGGAGRILGTLIGAFIISVIQNGMNLLGFDSYLQQVVLGGVILFAVLVDRIRRAGGLMKLLLG